MNFVAVARTTVTLVPPRHRVAHFEITNLTGRVIARTVDASEANRAGAIALAKRRMGGCYEISSAGTYLRTLV